MTKENIFGKMPNIVGSVLQFLGFKSVEEIPIDAENKKTNFTAEQVEKFKAAFGDKYQDYIDAMDNEVKLQTSNNFDLKALEDELEALLQEKQNLSDANEEGGTSETDAKTKIELIKANQAKTDAKLIEQDKLIKKLMGERVGDVPEAIIRGNEKMKNHSATHLFASGKVYDKFEGRAWNERLRDGSIKATDFREDAIIPLLQNDAKHFIMENPKALQSLFNDIVQLPTDWSSREGVIESIAEGRILTDEIVQGRAKGWSPNQKFKIDVEKRFNFRKKIDIEFSGYELQQIENTWINSYNANDGSHPYKMSFVGFLISEIMKRRMADDVKAQIIGIYSDNGGGNDNPGRNVDSQDGLLYNFWLKRNVEAKYRPTDLGLPTTANIVEYIDNLIKSLPETVRGQQGLELGISQAWLEAYRNRAGGEYQRMYKDDLGKRKYNLDFPIDYPNIKFQPVPHMVKTDFMYITQSQNIEQTTFRTAEKTQLTFSNGRVDPRNITAFGDYRLGIGLVYVGTKLAAGESKNLEAQLVWSNTVPVFPADTVMPLYDDKTGIINFHYSNMKVDASWVTDITQLDNAPKGMIIKITGDTGLVASKSVKHNANFVLAGASDFDLKSGGTLTLQVQNDGTCKEIKRTTAPATVVSTDVSFDIATIDANDGSVFRFDGATATTLTNIIGGYEGKEITIYGSAVELTVDNVSGNISVTATAVLDATTKYIKLVNLDGEWIETIRLV